MKTTHHKTSNAPWMKRITMYICFIVALCLFNLNTVMATDPPVTQSDPNKPSLTTPPETSSEEEEPQFENLRVKQHEYLKKVAGVWSAMYWMAFSISRNIN